MDFSLTEEQLQLRDRTRRFAQDNLAKPQIESETTASVDGPWKADWQAVARFGVFSSLVPEAYGGHDAGVIDTILMLEALGEGCADNGLTLGVNGQLWAVMEPILAFGTEEQKKKYLPGFCNGTLLGAHGMTESASGSNAFALATTAEATGDGYILNGEKVYIGLGPACDVALVFATVDPTLGRWGISAFLVEATDAGFSRGPAENKLGLKSSPLGSLRLENCFVPKDRLLGEEGTGAAIFNHSMEWERSFIFASHVGRMARQLEDCANFAHERQVFGQSIEQNQSVSNRLADMRLRLETSRLLLYKTAWMKSQNLPCASEAAMAKLHISESFAASSMDAVRIHGGLGYMEDSGVPRDLRDAVGGVIYSGTSDIQRQIIASLLRSDL